MPYRVAQRLRIPFAGALLVCVVLFLLSGLPLPASVPCCGDSMNFPFLCLGILLALFSTIAWVYCSTRKKVDVSHSPAVSSRPFQHLAGQVLSDYLRGWFFVSLLLSMTLVLFGAALLFSLSLRFTPSALALGCLSVVDGLDILLLGMYRP